MQYLVSAKGYNGKVVKSFSVSDKIQVLATEMGLETITTKIGFKYICTHMVEDDVLIGAEESGGIAIKGHIPERDGIWMGLALMEYCLKMGKTIKELIEDVYEITGSFAVERYDLHLEESKKVAIIERAKSGSYEHFGAYKIESIEDTDGFKFRLNTGSWVMIRPSGTEPVLRVYAEAPNSEEAFKILDETKNSILA
jgi:phosphomannomutase